MNIFVYGAGVLRSLYAARLQESGCNRFGRGYMGELGLLKDEAT